MLAIVFVLSMFQGKMIMFKPLRFQIALIISSVLHKIAFQFFISVFDRDIEDLCFHLPLLSIPSGT